MEQQNNNIISNEKIDNKKIETAREIICGLYQDIPINTKNGAGPFVAAIYDDKGNFVVKSSNSVVNDKCSNNHAEMNAIKAAEKKYNKYDLSEFNLKLYITAEPCVMCMGAVMWSGIKEIYYGVPTKYVEEITGFDEGFKSDWFDEFKKRGIIIYGNIEADKGKEALLNYMKDKKQIYKPQRNIDITFFK